jgi:hypothetical protein
VLGSVPAFHPHDGAAVKSERRGKGLEMHSPNLTQRHEDTLHVEHGSHRVDFSDRAELSRECCDQSQQSRVDSDAATA